MALQTTTYAGAEISHGLWINNSVNIIVISFLGYKKKEKKQVSYKVNFNCATTHSCCCACYFCLCCFYVVFVVVVVIGPGNLTLYDVVVVLIFDS